MTKKIVGALAVAAAAVLAVFGFMVWSARSAAAEAVSAYNAAVQEYSEKIGPYNEAAAGIAAENARLQEVLDQAGSVIAQGKEAYEPDTLDMLQEEMKKAEKALADVPARLDPFAEMEMSGSFNRKELEAEKLEAEAAEAAVGEAMEKIPPLPEVPDFTDRIDAVQKAQKVYEDSVRRLANVTAPADAFVRERVRGLETVMQTAAVSEKNDPNGLLGKTGGYLGCVYFLDERIDLNLLPAEVMPEEEGSDDGPAESESAPEEAGEGAGSGGSSGESASVAAEEADSAGTGKTAAASAPGERDAAASSETASEAEVTTTTTAPAGVSAGTAATSATAAAASAEPSPEEEGRYDVVAAGTDGGGAVEVYATKEEAEARDKYLAFFSGSVIDPGAHAVEGTCVIRASRYLEVDQQQALIEAVRQALLKVE